MLDFLIGLAIAALFLRGWFRGFVKELVDLAGLILGVIVAFRMSVPFGNFLSDRFQVSPEFARVGAGLALFLIVGAGLSVAAHMLTKVMKLPGLNMTNRLLGAALAGSWGMAVLVVLTTVVRVLPFPPAVDEALDGSTVVTAVAGPEAIPRKLLTAAAGDDVLAALAALERITADRRIVLDANDRVDIPPATQDQLELRTDDARLIALFINQDRLDASLPTLAWSDALAAVARAHAEEMYLAGYVSHVSPTTGTVVDRVAAAGIRLTAVGENLALAADARAVHRGLMDSPPHRENIMNTAYDRVGIAAVDGPLGLMVVEVFGG